MKSKKPVYEDTFVSGCPWKFTGNTRWETVKRAAGYRLERLQWEAVNFDTAEVEWIDIKRKCSHDFEERVLRDDPSAERVAEIAALLDGY